MTLRGPGDDGLVAHSPEAHWPTVTGGDTSRIVHWSAAELSVAIRRRVVSCVQVMTAYLDHVERINPHVNALVSLRPREDLLAEAGHKDDRLARGEYDGWMHGFPQAPKDLLDVEGLPTTRGLQSPADVGPAIADSLPAARLRAAGAVFIGKTNTPELGLGSHTYNGVLGTTCNAYDQSRSAGGSSGGAAVAVALRMLPVADGSDFMGSLRNPAGWNNVLGMRPSFGRVPVEGEAFVDQGGVVGPIARTATDLALMLATLSGGDDRAPLSIEDPLDPWSALSRQDQQGRRVAWLGDLGGYLPMEPEVLRVTGGARSTFAELGISVDDVERLPSHGSFRGNGDLWPTWLVHRHWLVGSGLAELYDDPSSRERMKPEARYEVEGLVGGAGRAAPLSALEAYRGSVRRTDLYLAFRELFRHFDYVVLPTAQVMPFPASWTWPRQINGVAMSSYHRWMEVATIGTLLNAPVVALPAGFDSTGLPIGLQVIGRNHADAELIGLARAWESATGHLAGTTPSLLRAGATGTE